LDTRPFSFHASAYLEGTDLTNAKSPSGPDPRRRIGPLDNRVGLRLHDSSEGRRSP